MENGRKRGVLGLLVLGIVVGAVTVACRLSVPTSTTATAAPTSTLTLNANATIATITSFSDFLPQGASVVLFTTADCDDDGELESVVLYGGEDAYSEGYGLVVETDNSVHHLGGELFVTDTAPHPVTVEVYDHNSDGRVEILVTGQIGAGATAVNIFRWNAAAYSALMSLVGEDGILIEEGGRVIARSNPFGTGYFIEKVAAWDGQRYRVSSRYKLSVDLDACLSLEESPSCVVVAFYELLGDGKTATAHTLLGKELQAETDLEDLVKFGRTLTALDEESNAEPQTVQVKVMSEGEERYGTWRLRLQKGQWVLVDFQLGAAVPKVSE